MKSRLQKVSSEVRSIGTIDLACKAENFLGKLFWSSLLVLGVAWAVYFVGMLFDEENPIMTTIEETELEEVTKPAITFCPKGNYQIFNG